MDHAENYLDLFDFRLQVAAMYRERNRALRDGEDPASVAERFRRQRDRLFAEHPQSALDGAERSRFAGLRYFPYNPAAVVEAVLDTDVPPFRLTVGTSGEEAMPMSRVGILRFRLGRMDAALSLFWIDVYGGGLFLPFRDSTAPDRTYGGGRYLFDTIKGSDFLTAPGYGLDRPILDFNYAYNPSCAYNPLWVCPLAPLDNRLPFPVEAGELIYHAEESH